jgi:hypothetical protein
MKRPLGVTVLAVLYILGGLGSGIITVLVYLRLDSIIAQARTNIGRTGPIPSDQVATVVYALFIVLALASALTFIIGAGLWTLEQWAWTLVVIMTSGGLVVNGVAVVLGAASPVGLIPNTLFSLVSLVYLLSPGVRGAFGSDG